MNRVKKYKTRIVSLPRIIELTKLDKLQYAAQCNKNIKFNEFINYNSLTDETLKLNSNHIKPSELEKMYNKIIIKSLKMASNNNLIINNHKVCKKRFTTEIPYYSLYIRGEASVY